MIAEIIILWVAGAITSTVVTLQPAITRIKNKEHKLLKYRTRYSILYTIVAMFVLPMLIPSLLSTEHNEKLINSLMEMKYETN